ncbi:MAG: DUF192 domain-containing protein [Candidatus Dormibacteria bacterium]
MSEPELVPSTGPRWRRPRMVVLRAPDGSVVARDVKVGDGFWDRLVGLMGRSHLDPDEGLWLLPCRGVQTMFMRTPLDVAYLDRDQKVVLSVPEMPPWRGRWVVAHAHSAVELAPGTLRRHGIEVGQQLTLERTSVDPLLVDSPSAGEPEEPVRTSA